MNVLSSTGSTRPRYGRAAATGVAGVLGGVAVLLLCLWLAIGSVPGPFTQFPAGQTARVGLDRAGSWTVYAAGGDTSPGASRCEVRGPGGTPVPVAVTSGEVQVSGGGRHWTRVARFATDSAGTLAVTCTGQSRYGLAESPRIARFVAWLVGGILGMLALLLGGVLTGARILLAGRRAQVGPRL